jgi:hypothetical protein
MKRVEIKSRDYWFKVVEFLQQNWALIDADNEGTSCTVFFFGDDSQVFDRMSFASLREAASALRRNGFARFDEDPNAGKIMALPRSFFREGFHPNGPIYSSGRFWI